MWARRPRGPRPLRLVCVVALLGGAAHAQPTSPLGEAALSYVRGRGAESCPDESELTKAVVARLGYDPFHVGAPRRLRVTIALEQATLRATLELEEPGATASSVHRLASTRLDCEVLHPALALAIALAVDPQRALSVDEAPAPVPAERPPRAFPGPLPAASNPIAPRAAHEPTPVGASAPPRIFGATRAPRTRPVGLLYGGALIAVAAEPTTTGGFELGGGILLRSIFSLALELRADVPTRGTASSGGRYELGRVTTQLVPCIRAFSFGFCAVVAAGVTYAHGEGFVFSQAVQAPYFAAGARLMAELPLGRGGRVRLGFHADVFGLATRVVLRVDGAVVYRDAPASGAFGVTVGGRFGDGT